MEEEKAREKEEEARRCAEKAEEADRDNKQGTKVLYRKEEEAATEAERVEEKKLADKKKAESEKTAEEREGEVTVKFIDVDNHSPTGEEGDINATTAFPNKGDGKRLPRRCLR